MSESSVESKVYMSVTFTKLFSSITESTVWCEPDRTRLVWITMLAMADRMGRVWASIPGLANRARVPVEDARKAIETFLSPDPDSRTKTEECEGRRIEVIDGGWRLINHSKYRAIRDEEAIKEAKRKYINTRRAVEKLSTVDRGRHNAEAEADTDKSKTKGPGFALPDWVPIDAWQGFEEMRKKIRKPLTDRARKLILAELKKLGDDPVALLNQSVQNSWSGIFPLKVKSSGDGPPWWASNEGIQAKAKELGISAKPGESWNDLKARISERMGT